MLSQKFISKMNRVGWHSIILAGCLLLWQSVMAQTTGSPSLPSLGTARAMDSKGQTITINSKFFGGVSVNGKAFATTVTQNLSDQANVQGLVTVDDQQVGQLADILVVIGYKPLYPPDSTEIFYMLGEGNQLSLWDMQVSSLIAYQRGVKLVKSQPINIFQGSPGNTGYLRIIFGYRLTNGAIIYNANSLNVKVNDDSATNTIYGVWEDFLGQELDTLALPDYQSNYFAFSFDRTGENQYIGLRIHGEFAYARYLSYNIYDAKQGTSYGAMTDFQIQPDPDNINPYVPGNNPQTTARRYSITVLPKGYADTKEPNVFTFDSQAISILSVMIRYYVPQGDEMGSVPLPTVEAFDVRTNQSVPLPPRYLIKSKPDVIYGYRLSPLFDVIVDDTLRFYHSAGGGQFNNADNAYLIAAVAATKEDVLLVHLRPPTYATNNSEFGSTQVRYWSINQGNANTSTPFGMRDEAFKIASDGMVYLAVGDESIRTVAEQRGYNFMPWQVSTQQGALLYRNLITDTAYPGNIQGVPQLDLTNPQNIYSQDAKNYIGDYAPTGKKVNINDFLNGSVDIVPPK